MARLSNVFVLSVLVMAAECLLLSAVYAAEAKSLAATVDVYVFPAEGQAASQQSKDESACYEWSVQNTGVDPLASSQQQPAPPAAETQSSQRGAGVRGGLRGAAAGAVVGKIVDDDAGKGAAIGATVGAISGRRSARAADQAAQASAEQAAANTAAANEQQLGNFKKAFAACLEAKDYTIKY